MSAVILAFPGCELPSGIGYQIETAELDHANREALAAVQLSTLIMARNRHSLAWPGAARAREVYARVEVMREEGVGVEDLDRSHLRELRIALKQIQWLLDRAEGRQARAKGKQ